MKIDDIVQEVSQETGYPVMAIREVYSLYWKCLKDNIEKWDFSGPELTEGEFNNLHINFSIPSIGKFGITYLKYQYMRRRKERMKKPKENKDA